MKNMKNDQIVIKVENLTKVYKLFRSPGERLAYQLFRTKKGTDYRALNEISFQVRKGEAFAVIGKNGSGKSTLLQILAGIIKKTSGDVEINGRIAALLELGSGFDPESTGYENIYMNSSILGADKKHIEKKIQQIIEFADIGEYLYQPVKTYSSGMFVRLGFAVAINVDADILLIDEALAVGDIFFRQKCYARLNELRKNGVTIVLVTHNMSEVEQFCERAIYLKNGEIVSSGKSSDVVQYYYLDNQPKRSSVVEKKSKNAELSIPFVDHWNVKEPVFFELEESQEIADGSAHYIKIGLFDENGNAKREFQQGEKAYFYAEIQVEADIDIPVHAVILYDQRQLIVHGKDTMQMNMGLPTGIKKGQLIRLLHIVQLDVAEGEYTFSMGLGSVTQDVYNNRSAYIQEDLHARTKRHCTRTTIGSFAVHQKDIGAPTRMMFHGLCNLQTEIFIGVN